MANAGAAYVFTRGLGAWSQQAYVKAVNTGAEDRIGGAIAVSGDTLAVAANEMAVAANFETGIGSGTDADPQMRGTTQTGAVLRVRAQRCAVVIAGVSQGEHGRRRCSSEARSRWRAICSPSVARSSPAERPTRRPSSPLLAGRGVRVRPRRCAKWALGAHVVASNPSLTTSDAVRRAAVAIDRGIARRRRQGRGERRGRDREWWPGRQQRA